MNYKDYLQPQGWASEPDRALPRIIRESLDRRDAEPAEVSTETDSEDVDTQLASCPVKAKWYTELEDVNHLKDKMTENVFQVEILELLGIINCTVLAIEKDCLRKTTPESMCLQHELHFFTNHRALQVYCAHSYEEHVDLDNLLALHRKYERSNRHWDPETYEEFMKSSVYLTRPLLIWETIFPSGKI